MSTGKLKAALGGRYCIIGDSRSGRTQLLRHITMGYGRTRYIATDFINSAKIAANSRVLLINKPERELDAAARAEFSALLRSFAGTVFFITNDIDFINSTATNITDTFGNVLAGGWSDFVAFAVSSKLLYRQRTKMLPVTAFPRAAPADFAAAVPVLGRIVPISAAAHVFFTGPRASAALTEVYAGIVAAGGAAGYYEHTFDDADPLPPREYFDAMNIQGRYPLLSIAEFARLGLAAALARGVLVLSDPTRYLSIPQIFGLIEHLRGRTVVFTSEDSEFIRMMRSGARFEWEAAQN